MPGVPIFKKSVRWRWRCLLLMRTKNQYKHYSIGFTKKLTQARPRSSSVLMLLCTSGLSNEPLIYHCYVFLFMFPCYSIFIDNDYVSRHQTIIACYWLDTICFGLRIYSLWFIFELRQNIIVRYMIHLSLAVFTILLNIWEYGLGFRWKAVLLVSCLGTWKANNGGFLTSVL